MGGTTVTPRKRGRLTAIPREPGARGRMLYVEDIVKLLGGRKSKWWIGVHFAPEYKQHLGRTPYWWEADAMRWLDERGRSL